MNDTASRKSHWDSAYSSKGDTGLSWFESVPATSLDLIRGLGTGSIIDIGGGASRLVDALLGEGFRDVTVLDISAAALDASKARLGPSAAEVEWIVADVTRWRPQRTYDIWHDRAAFHFLVDAEDRRAYAECLRAALAPDGHAIIATFAPDGPEGCSGLPVRRYDPEALAHTLEMTLVESRRYVHETPWASTQAFQFSVLRRG